MELTITLEDPQKLGVLFGPADHPILDKLRELDLDGTTPLESLQLIRQWQAELADLKQPKPR